MGATAIISFLMGLGLLLAPDAFMSNYGVSLDPVGKMMANGVGGLLLGLATINWFSKEGEKSRVLRAIILGNIVIHAVLGLFDFQALNLGIINSNGWGAVGLHLVLGFGFLYYFLQKDLK